MVLRGLRLFMHLLVGRLLLHFNELLDEHCEFVLVNVPLRIIELHHIISPLEYLLVKALFIENTTQNRFRGYTRISLRYLLVPLQLVFIKLTPVLFGHILDEMQRVFLLKVKQ